MGQGVIWYTGQFYALFFLTITEKVDYVTAYWLVGIALLLGTPFFLFFGSLSDRIGRLKIILAGCLIGAVTYFPLFHMLADAVNPDLSDFAGKTKLTVTVDPAQCHFNVFAGPWSTFGDCDKAKDFLTKNGLSFTSASGDAGSKATLDVNGTKVEGFSPYTWSKALADAGYPHLKAASSDVALTKEQADKVTAAQNDKKAADALAVVSDARIALDAKAKKIGDIANLDKVDVAADGTAKATITEIASTSADKSKIDWTKALFSLFIMMIYVTMVYGPIAAYLVELFPTAIRYTSMSLPYHIGNGWFGGLLPLIATAMVAYYGDIYVGLWYPIVVALVCAVIGFFFLHETKDVDIKNT
jgi:hypothetical protein